MRSGARKLDYVYPGVVTFVEVAASVDLDAANIWASPTTSNAGVSLELGRSSCRSEAGVIFVHLACCLSFYLAILISVCPSDQPLTRCPESLSPGKIAALGTALTACAYSYCWFWAKAPPQPPKDMDNPATRKCRRWTSIIVRIVPICMGMTVGLALLHGGHELPHKNRAFVMGSAACQSLSVSQVQLGGLCPTHNPASGRYFASQNISKLSFCMLPGA